MKAIHEHLDIPTMEQIINVQMLRFLEKCRPYAGRLTGSRGLEFTNLNRGSIQTKATCLRGSRTPVSMHIKPLDFNTWKHR
jgi:hypothetical protein